MITAKINGLSAKVIINSGASGNFISPAFVIKNHLQHQAKDEPYTLNTVDGSPSTYGKG